MEAGGGGSDGGGIREGNGGMPINGAGGGVGRNGGRSDGGGEGITGGRSEGGGEGITGGRSEGGGSKGFGGSGMPPIGGGGRNGIAGGGRNGIAGGGRNGIGGGKKNCLRSAAAGEASFGVAGGLKVRRPAENTWRVPFLFDLRRSSAEVEEEAMEQNGSLLRISLTEQPFGTSTALAGSRTLNTPRWFVLISFLKPAHSTATEAPEMKWLDFDKSRPKLLISQFTVPTTIADESCCCCCFS